MCCFLPSFFRDSICSFEAGGVEDGVEAGAGWWCPSRWMDGFEAGGVEDGWVVEDGWMGSVFEEWM